MKQILNISSRLCLIVLLATAVAACSSSSNGNGDGTSAGEENPVVSNGGVDPETPSVTPPPAPQPETPPPATQPVTPPIATRTSCTAIDLVSVGAGTQKISVSLQAGERLQIVEPPRGTVVSFDETLGELQYAPPAGRAPDAFTYNVLAPDNTVTSTGSMTLRLDPIRVMPLGDSITHGVEVGTGSLDTPPVPLRVGYRQSLLEQLAAAGQVVDFTGQGGQRAGGSTSITDTDNNGYPGVDISFINDRVLEIFAELPSDVVLLHIGTNLTPTDASGIDAILNNIDAWEAANNPVTVFVATLIPKRDPNLQATVDQFNADLRIRIAARLTDNVILVEQANAVTIADIDPMDVGVHPTAPGYLRMANTWFEAMSSSDLFPTCE